MARTIYSAEQRKALLTQFQELKDSGLSTGAACQKMNISPATVHKWRWVQSGEGNKKPKARAAEVLTFQETALGLLQNALDAIKKSSQ